VEVMKTSTFLKIFIPTILTIIAFIDQFTEKLHDFITYMSFMSFRFVWEMLLLLIPEIILVLSIFIFAYVLKRFKFQIIHYSSKHIDRCGVISVLLFCFAGVCLCYSVIMLIGAQDSDFFSMKLASISEERFKSNDIKSAKNILDPCTSVFDKEDCWSRKRMIDRRIEYADSLTRLLYELARYRSHYANAMIVRDIYNLNKDDKHFDYMVKFTRDALAEDILSYFRTIHEFKIEYNTKVSFCSQNFNIDRFSEFVKSFKGINTKWPWLGDAQQLSFELNNFRNLYASLNGGAKSTSVDNIDIQNNLYYINGLTGYGDNELFKYVVSTIDPEIISFLDYDVYDKTVKNEKLEKYGCFTDVLEDKIFSKYIINPCGRSTLLGR